MPEMQMDTAGWPLQSDGSWPDHHARHRLSRRAFLGSAAGTTGALLGASILRPASALAGGFGDDSPEPTNNTVVINGVAFHFTAFGPGVDPSSITDFKGLVGVADVQGTGTATNPDGSTETLLFDTDMRFMKGTYVGRDGSVHKGSFQFI